MQHRFIYVAVVRDAWSRRVVGYAISRSIESRVEPALVVDLLDEVRKVVGNIVEAVEVHRIDRSTFKVFMKLSALALSYGFPRLPIEPASP